MSWLSDAWDWATRPADALWGYVDHAIELLKEWARKALEAWIAIIDTTIHDIYGSVGWLFSRALTMSVDLLKQGVTLTAAFVRFGWDRLKDATDFAQGLVNGVYDFVRATVRDITNFIAGRLDWAYHAWVEPLWQGIKDTWNWSYDHVINPAINAVKWAAEAEARAIRSIIAPFVAIYQWIIDVAVPVVNWLAKRIPTIERWVFDPFGQFANLFNGIYSMGGRTATAIVTNALENYAPTVEDAVVRWLG